MISSRQILRRLTVFSVPLILSGLLQQLFNWVDALIVGNILGETVLAGVGSTTSLYNLFIMILTGLTSGLSVLFAQQHGEGKPEENAKLLATYAVLLTGIFTIISAAGIVFLGPILTRMDTPPDLYETARAYLGVVLMGIPFLALYNTYAACLRGRGNSAVPFAAVLICSVANGILDWIFIAYCGFGVRGAASATVLSQIAMTVFLVLYTVKACPDLRFSLFRRNKNGTTLRRGASYALPPAIQSSVTAVGNLFLQRFMNSFGEQTVAAITTAYRIDSVLLLPIFNFSTGISTLVAQETGARNPEEARRIFRLGTVMMAGISLGLTALILLTGRFLLSMFGLTMESVSIGADFFRSIATFYVVFGISQSFNLNCLDR